MDISAHITLFEQEMKRRNYGTQTINNYSSCLKKFFGQSNKDHPKNIHENDIRTFLFTFNEPNTQRSYHSAIKMFYNICLGQKNKFKYIPYAKKSHKLPIVLSALLYSCSLRVSELINLKWTDIDRSRRIINIIQAKGKKDRQVGLNDKLIELLTDYFREYKSIIYVLNGQGNHAQYSERSVGEVVKQLAAKAGIDNKRIYTHLMRHTSATHMVEAGTDINLIQKLLGHSNVKTTSIYCHISHNHISKIQSPLESILI